MNQEKTGKFISKLRKEKGITQNELAEELGISNKAVSKWERGINSPDISLLIPISKYFNITVNELLEGEKSNKKEEKVDNIIEYSNIKIKYNRNKFIKIIVILLIIFITIVSLFIYNDYSLKKEQNTIKEYTVNTQEKLKSLNYKKDNFLGSNNWVLNDNNTIYVVPEISYKDSSKTSIYKDILSYDSNKILDGIIIYYNKDKISVYYYEKDINNNLKKIMINCNNKGNLSNKKYTKKEKKFYKDNKLVIKKRIKDIKTMWNKIYN